MKSSLKRLSKKLVVNQIVIEDLKRDVKNLSRTNKRRKKKLGLPCA